MIVLDRDLLVGLGLGVLTGAAIAVPITYWALMPSKNLNSLQAFYKGKEAAFKEITMERIPGCTQEGIVRKKYYLVIRERLLNNNLPMSPFWEHKFLTAEKLDKDDLLE